MEIDGQIGGQISGQIYGQIDGQAEMMIDYLACTLGSSHSRPCAVCLSAAGESRICKTDRRTLMLSHEEYNAAYRRDRGDADGHEHHHIRSLFTADDVSECYEEVHLFPFS